MLMSEAKNLIFTTIASFNIHLDAQLATESVGLV